jgi:hypothetical protein
VPPIVEVELNQIVVRENSDYQYIFLREKGGERKFPIVIGPPEAAEIERRVKGQKTARPLTHELLARVLTSLGGRLEHAVVNDLRDGTFYAKLVLRQGEAVHEIDARPSDAIALAVRHKTPIFVEESVLELASKG